MRMIMLFNERGGASQIEVGRVSSVRGIVESNVSMGQSNRG